jgi:heat shock protein HslJ
MNLRTNLMATGVVLAILHSTACTTMTSAPDAPDLEGTAWVLSSLPGRSLVEGAAATLRFEDGRVSGTDGCNRYATSYTVDGSKLNFGAAGAATMMACPPAIMEQARAFTSSLAATSSHRIEAGQLQLLGPDGAVVASFAAQSQALAGTSWRVTGYNNGRQAVVSVLAGTELSLAFAADGRVSGSAGCNNFMGTYIVSGPALKLGPAATTRKLCAQPGVMEQEQQFLKALESVATIRHEGDRAELRTSDGALALHLLKDAAQ